MKCALAAAADENDAVLIAVAALYLAVADDEMRLEPERDLEGGNALELLRSDNGRSHCSRSSTDISIVAPILRYV